MRFTVVAVESVDEKLAKIYLEAADPQAISRAADWLEKELKNDPLSKMTPVDDLFFLRRGPLVVLCEIRIEDRLVKIVEINRIDI